MTWPALVRWAGWVWLAWLGMASSAAAGEVRGYVEAPASGARVPGVEVTLLVSQHDSLAAVARQTTDAQGAFAFSGPFLEDGLRFVLTAEYRGAPHPSSLLTVGDQQQVILEVYEPTTEDPGLRLASLTVFLSLQPQGLDVAQLVQVRNPGDRTFVGAAGAASGQVTEFVLPPGARGVHSPGGRLVAGEGNRVYDQQPLLPGLTEIAFTYTLDLEESGPDYRLLAAYPTELVEVYVQPASVTAPAAFEDLGVVEIEGASYRRLRHAALAPGEEVVIPLPIDRAGQRRLKWLALAGVVAVGAAVFAVARRGRVTAASPSPATAADPELTRRDALVAQLARLDEEFRLQPDDATYQRRREALVTAALALDPRLESDRAID